MQIPYTVLPKLRLGVIVAFAALAAVVFGVLWTNSGGRIPLVSRTGYQVDVALADVDNLVQLGDVRMAGVRVGRVQDVRVDGQRATARLELDDQIAPLHEGATVEVHNKTLIEETYLQVVDGQGAPIPDGTTLAQPAVSSTQLDDVLTSLDPQTRTALGALLRHTGTAVDGRREDVGAVVGGLGDIGREGTATLTALAEQSDDLRSLLAGTNTLMTALDTREGRIADLVRDSNTVFGAVSDSSAQVGDIMRRLLPVLRTAQDASDDVRRLSGSLAPVAAGLKAAAPPLSAALQELPATSADLRGLLPALDTTLDRAPATFDRIPTLATDLERVVPPAEVVLSDVNPVLAFVQPYGRDVAGFFNNFVQVLGVSSDTNGGALRTFFILNEQSADSPIRTKGTAGPLKGNAVPLPGTAGTPSPDGPSGWRKVEREAVPG